MQNNSSFLLSQLGDLWQLHIRVNYAINDSIAATTQSAPKKN